MQLKRKIEEVLREWDNLQTIEELNQEWIQAKKEINIYKLPKLITLNEYNELNYLIEDSYHLLAKVHNF